MEKEKHQRDTENIEEHIENIVKQVKNTEDDDRYTKNKSFSTLRYERSSKFSTFYSKKISVFINKIHINNSYYFTINIMNKFSKQDLTVCDLNVIIQNQLKAELFTILFQHMKVFSEHINILFEKDRMFIQSMDSSRISIFEVSLPKEWFDTYELKDSPCQNKEIVTIPPERSVEETQNSKKPVTIGIHSFILFRVLSARDKTQEIHFNFNSNENQDILNIHFTGNNKSEFDKHFEISLLDVDLELMSIPDNEPQAEFSVSSFHFANIINQLKMFGDNLDVFCSEEKIMLCSNSIEQGKMFVEIKIDDLSSFIIDEGGNIKMSFSLNSLHNICLYNKLSREVVISFKDSFPMKIVYSLFGHEHAKMTFYLAPKIGDED